MAEKKAGRKGTKRTIAKSASVEEHEGKPLPLVAEKGDLSIVQSSAYRGPLPRAHEFVEYKKGHKDAPERILRYMEKDQEQNHRIENSVNSHFQTQGIAKSRRKDKAQVFAFVLSLIALGAATILTIYTDKELIPVFLVVIASLLLVNHYFERLLTLFTKDKDKKK